MKNKKFSSRPHFVPIEEKDKKDVDCFDYRPHGLIFKRVGCKLTAKCATAVSGDMKMLEIIECGEQFSWKVRYCSGFSDPIRSIKHPKE